MISIPHLEGFKVRGSHELRLPSYVNVSKKTTKACNLNVYRNLHHHHLNSQKKNFKDEVSKAVRALPRMDKIWIHYTVFAPTARTLDTMNVGSIVDKYFSDALTELGTIPDDNHKHIVYSSFSFGGISKLDGHVIATIYELEKEGDSDMRILLDQADIQTALNTYVSSLNIPNAENATVELSVEDDEIIAEVLMGEAKPKNKGGRPKGSRNKTKPAPKEEVVEDAEESTDDTGSGTDSGGGEVPETDPAASEKPAEEEQAKAENPSKASEQKSSSSIFDSEDSGTEDASPTEDMKPKTKKSSIFDA